jgi:murein L,D-transpeptidase YafK
MRTKTKILLALLALFACAAFAAGQRLAPEATPVAEPLTVEEEELNRRPLKLPLKEPRVLVRKGARRLELFAGGERVRVFRMVLGFAPEGDKERQGDGRTPEGDFYVCTKNERSSFYLSLGLNYPDDAAAARGLRDGLITRAEHDRIVRANQEGRCPPWDTKLGGEIFIHGGGTASDWTFGCVALENEHVEELFEHLPAGTPVRVEP